MLPLVEFPELVQHYASFFEDVFSEAAFVESQRYISGLIVSENKTVEGINRLFVNESRNQSSLNRLLTVSPFSLKELNQKQHNLLSSLPGTQMKRDGALSIDATLLKHYGEHFEPIAYWFDHVEQNYTWARNLVTLHYSDNETDYPVHFQLWKPVDLEKLEQGLRVAGVKIKDNKQGLKETAPHKWRQYLLGLWRRHANQKADVAALYESKLRIAEALLQELKCSHPTLKLPVTFDSWYTQSAFCHFIEHDLQLNYVGALAEDQQVVLKTGTEKLADFTARLKQEHLDAVARGKPPVFKPATIPYKGGKEKYYSDCVTHRLHHFGKKRLVINHRQADLSDHPTCLISNRLNWQAPGITRVSTAIVGPWKSIMRKANKKGWISINAELRGD
jgi:hypothetical protein